MASELQQILPADLELFVLTGPTAVGKTEVALQWAERHGAEIVSCDSLLFYRGMDIGTAKPSPAERERVPHHLVDVAEAAQPWNVHRYLAAAVAAVAAIHRRGRRVLVAGGSGFYLKSFLAPVVDPLEIPAEVSRRVEDLAAQGPEVMVREITRLDPRAGESLDLQNPRRVARALERCLATGRSVRELKEEMGARSFPFALCQRRVCLLQRDQEDLERRIARRVDQMLEAGLVGEVRGLLENGLEKNPSAASAIGYRETIRYLAGDLPEAQLREEIIRNTSRLVKKQRTWFRHQLPANTRTLCLTGRERLEPEDLFA
jgi:tRNA dimethylallyltransferase